MVWEDRRLRDIAEADVSQLVSSGLEEHLQLEYKSALYDGGDRGGKECLLDICMFANAGGGILLLGVPERRDAQGQPTGAPDPDAPLGINIPNPEMALQSYDSRVLANIDDRLPLESAAISVANGLHVLALRIPNSTAKPHRVRYQGHVYFPSRRERQRYEMDIREIKEIVMRTASRLEEAERKLWDGFLKMPRQDDSPHLVIGCIPVFWRDFLVDLRDPRVTGSLTNFVLPGGQQNLRQPTYTFTGLERVVHNDISTVQVHRDGLVILNRRIQLVTIDATQRFIPTIVDRLLRPFLLRTADVYRAAGLSGPYLVGLMLRARNSLRGAYPGTIPGSTEDAGPVQAGDYSFPVVQADDLLELDRIMRPLCDQAHQMFGRHSSPHFDHEGVWIEPKN